MHPTHLLTALACVVFALPAATADNAPPEGFTALFNGKDFAGWKVPDGDNNHWKIANGVIDYDGKSESKEKHLWTEQEFGDGCITGLAYLRRFW